MKNNIKELREQHKMTQQECANIFGVKLRAWQTYEQGVSEPKFEMLLKIADYFNVSLDYLLGREPVENPFENLIKPVSDDKFIELYSGLPEYAKSIFLETMAKLSKAVTENEPMNNDISITTTLGTIEDERQADEAARQDAG